MSKKKRLLLYEQLSKSQKRDVISCLISKAQYLLELDEIGTEDEKKELKKLEEQFRCQDVEKYTSFVERLDDLVYWSDFSSYYDLDEKSK